MCIRDRSAGVWFDTGVITSYNTVNYTKLDDNPEIINSFDKTVFLTAKIYLTICNSDNTNVSYKELVIIHNGTSATLYESSLTSVGVAINPTLQASVAGDQIILTATCATGTKLKGNVSYLAI